jgi:hypothetical protein
MFDPYFLQIDHPSDQHERTESKGMDTADRLRSVG